MAEPWVVWGWVRPEWIQRRDECQGHTQAPTQKGSVASCSEHTLKSLGELAKMPVSPGATG